MTSAGRTYQIHAGTVSVPIEGTDKRGKAEVYIHAVEPGMAIHVAQQLRRFFPHCRITNDECDASPLEPMT